MKLTKKPWKRSWYYVEPQLYVARVKLPSGYIITENFNDKEKYLSYAEKFGYEVISCKINFRKKSKCRSLRGD